MFVIDDVNRRGTAPAARRAFHFVKVVSRSRTNERRDRRQKDRQSRTMNTSHPNHLFLVVVSLAVQQAGMMIMMMMMWTFK